MRRKGNGGRSVGLVIVCLCLIMPLTVAGISPSYKVSTIMLDPIVFHNTPENGVYWNDQKIANDSVPLYLHYRFKREIPMGISVTGDEIGSIFVSYDGGVLILQTGAPFGIPVHSVPVPVFGHSPTQRVLVVLQDGQTIWDNVTVYRLFP